MLNFAEQTGSGAVIVVWSFLPHTIHTYIHIPYTQNESKQHNVQTITYISTLITNVRTHTYKRPYISHPVTHIYLYYTYLPTLTPYHSLTCPPYPTMQQHPQYIYNHKHLKTIKIHAPTISTHLTIPNNMKHT